ncbi:hypothetical protein NFJ01_10580 [Lelliottia amnigena]|uniref:hypothetical protein n=1 Tax=Lelliottia amnigena TaxID=61646 RepID=UPI000FBBB082|nr:hypothetical protein [Lelliottia amnigena]USR62777.1 hypothetical protein NFJ01_10580 [Lelliottia amnigena]
MADVAHPHLNALKWPSYYPKNLIIPPQDSLLAQGKFYRLVSHHIPTRECFFSTHQEQPNRHKSKSLSSEDRVNLYGTSFFDNEDKARHTRDAFPQSLGGKLIAEGILIEYMGAMKKTRGPSHFTVWLKNACDIHQHFQSVEAVKS